MLVSSKSRTYRLIVKPTKCRQSLMNYVFTVHHSNIFAPITLSRFFLDVLLTRNIWKHCSCIWEFYLSTVTKFHIKTPCMNQVTLQRNMTKKGIIYYISVWRQNISWNIVKELCLALFIQRYSRVTLDLIIWQWYENQIVVSENKILTKLCINNIAKKFYIRL